MWSIILNIIKSFAFKRLIKLIIKRIMGDKKGSKLFGFIIKAFGKKASKEALIKNAVSALDTNKDGKITLEDFSKGNWKDIDWVKLSIAVLAVIGSIYFGLYGFADLV